jgi:signal recognition particle receptor subunit beta
MGVLNREKREIHAKIVFFGPQGAGTSTNLRFIHQKLRTEHRGELKTLGDERGGASSYEFLPVELGAIRGFRTSFQMYSIPQGAEHAAVRRKLLEDVDGVVFVADLRPDHHRATLASLKELEGHLRSYGRSFNEIVLVFQYNHRDAVQENAVEKLHRAIWVEPAAAFEAVAAQGTGVLGTLTTLSKLILAQLRHEADGEASEEVVPAVLATESPDEVVRMAEPSVVAERTGTFDVPLASRATAPELSGSKGFTIESGGPVGGSEEDLRIPIVLVEKGSGQRIELCVRLKLEPR